MAAIITAVILWGGSFAAMRIGVTALDPWSVMWVRMITAFVIILPFTVKLFPVGYKKGDWKFLVPMVFFQPCLYFLLESYALTYTTSSQAGVISASVPLMVAIAAWLLLSETITRNTVAGLMIAMSGVICLTLLEKDKGIAVNPLLGNTIEFFAMASAAANMVIVRQLSQRYNPWALTAMQVFAGSIFFLPGLVNLANTSKNVWSFDLVGSLVFLGVFVTLGAFGLYNWGISRMPAGKASSFINLVPVIAVLVGWSLLGESLDTAQCCAAVAVIGGVWLSQKKASKGSHRK